MRKLKKWVKVLVLSLIIESLLVVALLDLGIASVISLVLMITTTIGGIDWVYER